MPRLSVVCSPPPSANAMMVTLFRPPLDDQTNVQDARCRRWKSSTFFSRLDHHSLSRGRDKFDRPFPICFFLARLLRFFLSKETDVVNPNVTFRSHDKTPHFRSPCRFLSRLVRPPLPNPSPFPGHECPRLNVTQPASRSPGRRIVGSDPVSVSELNCPREGVFAHRGDARLYCLSVDTPTISLI